MLRERILQVLSFVFIFSLFNGCDKSKPGFFIRIRFNDQDMPSALFLKYYNGDTYISVDSLFPEKGRGIFFSGEIPLSSGMYAVEAKRGIRADFFISNSDDQHFSITFSPDDPLNRVSFRGSPENEAFAGYLKTMDIHEKQLRKLQSGMEQHFRIPDSVQAIQKRTVQIQKEVRDKTALLEKTFQGSMFSFYLKATRNPEIPEPDVPLMLANREQVLQAYYYNQTLGHFFDHIDFTDHRLLMVPVFKQKLKYYFTQLVIPQPDSIVARIDDLLARSSVNTQVKSWCTRYLYNLFRESPNPEHSGIPVYLAENHILSNPEAISDSAFLVRVANRVKKSKLNPVGFPATDLNLQMPDGKTTRLYSLSARYIVLYFFNPGCDACHAVTDKLIAIHRQFRSKGLKVYAVYLDRNREEWLKYLQAKKPDWINGFDPDGTQGIELKYDISAIPMIYLLDRDKKVVLKDAMVEGLEKFLNKEEEIRNLK